MKVKAALLRPCRPLFTWWNTAGAPAVTFQVVPFSDETDSFSAMCAALGRTIDVFLITWSSAPCPEGAAFLPLGTCRCVVALSRSHPLAAKSILSWSDLAGETLLLLREGESPVVDAIRADIRRNRRPVRMLDFDGYYDMSVFNRCARPGALRTHRGRHVRRALPEMVPRRTAAGAPGRGVRQMKYRVSF